MGCITGGTEVTVNTNFRSGGGFSRYYSVPTLQASSTAQYLASGVSLPTTGYYNPNMRGVPDVSMYGTGVGIIVVGMLTDAGGTSLSSPLFAVIVSLLNEVSLNAGGSTLGYLSPLLYYMALPPSWTAQGPTRSLPTRGPALTCGKRMSAL
jgi:subtilase family serine protease